MSITTKTGDRGKTSLYCGRRVAKDDIRVEACGALDEAVSFLGLARAHSTDKKTKDVIYLVQKQIFMLCSEISASGVAAKRLKEKIDKDAIRALEKEIDGLESKRCVKMKGFCVPGSSMVSSALDMARAITRRAERRSVTMSRKGMMKNRNIIVYLNRLSDLLFLLARLNENKK